jgi:hypothetical protein
VGEAAGHTGGELRFGGRRADQPCDTAHRGLLAGVGGNLSAALYESGRDRVVVERDGVLLGGIPGALMNGCEITEQLRAGSRGDKAALQDASAVRDSGYG